MSQMFLFPSLVPAAQAAIGYDATSSTTAIEKSSFSWSHTVTSGGSDRILIVGFNFWTEGTPNAVSTVTYNGTSLTNVRGDVVNNIRSEVWYLVNPSTGTNTISVTLAGMNKSAWGGAVSLTGVDQTNPVDANNGATGTSSSASVSVTTVADNAYLFDATTWNNKGTMTVGANQTQRWNSVIQSQTGGGSTEAGGSAGSHTMSWSLSASDDWAASAASFKPGAVTAYTQNYYRWYQNTDAIQPSTVWDSLGENTAIAQSNDPPASGEVVRLRMTAQISGLALPISTQAFKLQYGQGATCSSIGTWTDVGGLGSAVIWRGYDNATPSDGVITTATLISIADELGSYEEVNNSSVNTAAVAIGDDIEYDWVIQNNSATNDTQYCFRMTLDDGTVFGTYTNYPQLYTNVAPSITSVTDSPDPLNSGSVVTFSTDWSDTNTGENVKAKVCKTDSLTGQNCDGGFWATSTAFTTSDPEAVTYTTQGSDEGTNSYYVFVCDDGGDCSSSSTGTFTVNQTPTITSVTDSPDPVSSANLVTFSVDWNDGDAGENIKAKICKTDSLTGQNCDGGFWATSTAFTTSDPEAVTYTTLDGDSGSNSYYAFVCDDAGVCSSSSSGSFTVNVSVTEVRIQSGSIRIQSGSFRIQ